MIDPNIPLSVRNPQFKSATESYGQALSLKNLMNQGKQQDMQMQLTKKELDTYDQRAALEGQKAQQEFDLNKLKITGQQIENGIKIAQRYGSLLGAVKDPMQYGIALRTIASELGEDAIKDFPQQYDPAFVQSKAMESLSLSDQLAQIMEQQKLQEEKRHNMAMESKQPTQVAARPVTIMKEGRQVIIDANTGEEIGQAPPLKSGSAMSATAQKELFEADDVIQSGQNAVDILQSILAVDPGTGKSQNDIAYSGGLANFQKGVANLIPGSSPETDASVDLENKVTGQALESLKSIFGGMPTEGERKILLDLQGSLTMTPQQREKVFKRAIELATKRIEFNQKKADQLRKGAYFSEQQPQSGDANGDGVIDWNDLP